MMNPRSLLSRVSLFVTLASLFSFVLFSTAAQAGADEVKAAIKRALPQYSIDSMAFHKGINLYTVELKDGPTLHMSPDGKYFIVGDMYKIDGSQIENETQQEKLAKIESLPVSKMIVFKAKNEKAHITVFTDVDCAYCRMLHKEVPELNKMGITVRYLAYPRAGIGSPAYKKMVSVWCSDNPQEWFTKATEGEDIPENTCANPVASDCNLGNDVGVRGTPTMILSNGKFVPGYLPANVLAKELGL